jgi:ferredoxin
LTDFALVAKILFMSKINIDPKKCIGCGLCTSITEECFRINDQGKAEAVGECEGDGGCEGCKEKVKEAIESCPVQAITVEE